MSGDCSEIHCSMQHICMHDLMEIGYVIIMEIGYVIIIVALLQWLV